jgi:hypothetical protein
VKKSVPERSVRKELQNAFLMGKSSRMRADGSKKTAANTHTMPNPIAAPDFRWKISLDARRWFPCTPNRQKQVLINSIQ